MEKKLPEKKNDLMLFFIYQIKDEMNFVFSIRYPDEVIMKAIGGKRRGWVFRYQNELIRIMIRNAKKLKLVPQDAKETSCKLFSSFFVNNSKGQGVLSYADFDESTINNIKNRMYAINPDDLCALDYLKGTQ